MAEEEPARVTALKNLLDTFSEANARHPLRQTTVEKVDSSEEVMESLRALGYIR